MAEQLSKREISGIHLSTLELSSGEIEAIVASLSYVLNQLPDESIEELTGAYRDELEAICNDLRLCLDEGVDEAIEAEFSSEHFVLEPA